MPPALTRASRLRHVAIIMDGNRRWAAARGESCDVGHREGAENAVRIVRAASEYELGFLTLFAFSSANWRRSRIEIHHLFDIADAMLDPLAEECVARGVRIEVLGRRDRLPSRLRARLWRVVERTRQGGRCVRLALDYSSREAILLAARRLRPWENARRFDELVTSGPVPPVDLLIRTGCEGL